MTQNIITKPVAAITDQCDLFVKKNFDRIYLVFSFIQKGPFLIFKYPQRRWGPGPPGPPLDRPLICTNFAHKYDIQFNMAKCQLIKYGESDDVPFYFNGTLIEYVRHGVHLGHSIGTVTHCYMVRDVARDFFTHLNGILANFNYCELQTKYRLFVSYCTSYYGSCLWDLQQKLADVFYTTWRKAIRRLFGLPRNAHCNLLPLTLVAACLPIQSQLLNRCTNFVNSCLNSNNCILKLLSSL